MNEISVARNSAVALKVQSVPVLSPSMLSAEEAFVGFLTTQARSPVHAPLVIAELEKAGGHYRLDATLKQVLTIAKATTQHQLTLAKFH
jgi:hypothetical protein